MVRTSSKGQFNIPLSGDTADNTNIGKQCTSCDRKITHNQDSIECDHCNQWWHLKCSKLQKEEYKFLIDNPFTDVYWACPPCKLKIKQMTEKDNSDENVSQSTEKMDGLTKIVTGMQTQMTTMQQQMSVMLELIKNSQPMIQTENTMKAFVNEMLDDKKEMEEKHNNVIMFNIGELEVEDEEKEEEHDVKKVKEVISVILPDLAESIEITKKTVKRCGYKKKDKTRPIRLKLDDNATKGKIFVNAWKLREKDNYKKIGISNDKTKKEIMKDRELKAQLMDKKKATGEDDWMIYKGDIIKRADRPQRAKDGSQGQRK